MQIRHRLSRIERFLGQSGPGGSVCAACRSADRRVVALFKDDMPGFAAWPAPAQAPCPGCGRDLNAYLAVVFVDRITGRRHA